MPGVFRRKRNKFHVAPKAERTFNGVVFASKGEMQRHQQLLLAQRAGKISGLEWQVPIVISTGPMGTLLKWVADWRYTESGRTVLEDYTGVVTPLKRTKIRMCGALYPDIDIRLSCYSGSGAAKRLVLTACPNGKIPSKSRSKKTTPKPIASER